jgi:membrane protease YdiL (CAAX protease family)
MWLDPTSAHAAYPIWLYVLSTVGLSVLIGCLYARSGGNLLVAVMAHAASNSADGARYQLLGERGGELGAQLTLTAAVLAAAVVVVVATRGRLGADHLPDQAPRPPAGA